MARLTRLSRLQQQEATEKPDSDQQDPTSPTSPPTQDLPASVSRVRQGLLSFLESVLALTREQLPIPSFLLGSLETLAREALNGVDDVFFADFMGSFATSILAWIDEDKLAANAHLYVEAGVPDDGRPGQDSPKPEGPGDVLRHDGLGQVDSQGSTNGTLAGDTAEAESADAGQQAPFSGGMGIVRGESSPEVSEMATGDSNSGVGSATVC